MALFWAKVYTCAETGCSLLSLLNAERTNTVTFVVNLKDEVLNAMFCSVPLECVE
jgi:hypothetical protein